MTSISQRWQIVSKILMLGYSEPMQRWEWTVQMSDAPVLVDIHDGEWTLRPVAVIDNEAHERIVSGFVLEGPVKTPLFLRFEEGDRVTTITLTWYSAGGGCAGAGQTAGLCRVRGGEMKRYILAFVCGALATVVVLCVVLECAYRRRVVAW